MQYSFEDVQISIPQSDCFIKNKGKLTSEAARKVNGMVSHCNRATNIFGFN